MRLRRKKKKKGKKFVTLHLEKDGEIHELTIKTSMWGLTKGSKKIAEFLRRGWKLMEITGTDTEKVAMFKGLIAGYQPGDPIPVKRMVHEAGLKSVPKPLKRFFKKDESKQK